MRSCLLPPNIKEGGPLPSEKTDIELVSTFVAKAYVHDVKLTALPMASQVYTVLSVSIDLYKELLNLKTFRPDLY